MLSISKINQLYSKVIAQALVPTQTVTIYINDEPKAAEIFDIKTALMNAGYNIAVGSNKHTVSITRFR